MTKKAITVDEDTSVEEIAELMTKHRINRLPVLNGSRVIGIVSRADIVSAIASGEHIVLHTPVYDL
jgi:CBS domain-containing protein